MSTIYCGAVSRVLSFKMIIYLGRSLPTASSNLPGDETGSLMVSLFGLASDGVYTAASVTGYTVVSYTAFSPLRRISDAVLFCCTFPGVTSAGRYPASCPSKPGLSSYLLRSAIIRPTILLFPVIVILQFIKTGLELLGYHSRIAFYDKLVKFLTKTE